MPTMTLELTDKEMAVLEQIAQQKDISKRNIMRQALRVYQMMDLKLQEGFEMAWIDKNGNVEKRVIVGCGDLA